MPHYTGLRLGLDTYLSFWSYKSEQHVRANLETYLFDYMNKNVYTTIISHTHHLITWPYVSLSSQYKN